MNMEYQQSLTKIVKKVVTLKKLRKVRQDYGKKSVIDEHQKKQKNKKKIIKRIISLGNAYIKGFVNHQVNHERCNNKFSHVS